MFGVTPPPPRTGSPLVLGVCGPGAATAGPRALGSLESPGGLAQSPSPMKLLKPAGSVGVVGQTPMRADSRKVALSGLAADSPPPPLPPASQPMPAVSQPGPQGPGAGPGAVASAALGHTFAVPVVTAGGGTGAGTAMPAPVTTAAPGGPSSGYPGPVFHGGGGMMGGGPGDRYGPQQPLPAFASEEGPDVPPGMVQIFKDGYLYIVPEVWRVWRVGSRLWWWWVVGWGVGGIWCWEGGNRVVGSVWMYVSACAPK